MQEEDRDFFFHGRSVRLERPWPGSIEATPRHAQKNGLAVLKPPGSGLYKDSLPGVRLVMEGIESLGCLLNRANEARNVWMHSASSQRNAFQEIATGTAGLKSTAIATNPATQRYFRARHGATTLFAALSTLDGAVIGDCMPQHRHQEFTRFLKRIDQQAPSGLDLHLIVDKYATHKHPGVQRWLRRHPRFHLPFTPTSCSWLKLVERWFGNLTRQRLRRSSFHNVKELIRAIQDYIRGHNQNPRIFVWSASVERILAKVAKCKEALDALH